MSSDSQSVSMGEAVSRYLASLPAEENGRSQQEVYKLVRWYGNDRPLTGLTAPEVANYVGRLSSSDMEYAKKLEMVRAFLIYAKKEGWTKGNLATHLKTKTGKTRLHSYYGKRTTEIISLTQQGFDGLEAELVALKKKRLQVIDEMRSAAADKDFRENAPLDAAKEQCGHIEGRIRELEETLKSATIIDSQQEVKLKVSIGDSFLLLDMVSGEELRYTIVSPREVDPNKSKISTASPVGKAIIGCSQGDVVEVATPVGKSRYQIKQIER
ncbi:GreA/GreB family elongation factor [Chloroflexota bacterium]